MNWSLLRDWLLDHLRVIRSAIRLPRSSTWSGRFRRSKGLRRQSGNTGPIGSGGIRKEGYDHPLGAGW